MKKILMTLAVIASLCAFNSCGNDDDDVNGGDGSGVVGGNVSGSVQVDGKKINVKYGYITRYSDSVWTLFCDRDVYEYIDEDSAPNFEMSFISVTHELNGYGGWDTSDIEIGYKMNYAKGYGTWYCDNDDVEAQKLKFNLKGDVVSLKGNSIKVEKSDYDDNILGYAEASIDIAGKVIEIEDDEYDEYSLTRSGDSSEKVLVRMISDPVKIERLKALAGRK